MHNRFSPVPHRFHYNLFMWWIDLDEVDQLSKSNPFISHNRFNLFSFYDKDHIYGDTNKKSVRENIIKFLEDRGKTWDGEKIYLMTNLRTFGYLFNPVSFYYLMDKEGSPQYSIAEVGNTYYEMKAFLLENFDGKTFDLKIPKNFYVSPFTQLDDEFHFRLQVPGEKMNIKIDDYRKGEKFFISTLTGVRKPITSWSVVKAFLRFPMVTLQVIILIHWQALRLWLKKVPFHSKAANPELQQEVTRKHKSIAENLS